MKSMTDKPCTKLQYKQDASTDVYDYYDDAMHNVPKNQVKFGIQFVNPPRVAVKEEYIIYDSVAMVSAIGGTMGLCIGFSFSGIVRSDSNLSSWPFTIKAYCDLVMSHYLFSK